LNSCGVIEINGYGSDFKKLSIEEKRMLKEFHEFEKTEQPFIYPINGEQLREEVKRHSKVMVYEFKSNCVSATCYPLTSFVRYAQQNNYKLFLVLNSYASLSETIHQEIKLPIFVMDHIFYKTNVRSNYNKRFIADLLKGEEMQVSKGSYPSIYLFEDGKLVRLANDLLAL
jgi:hypothetical protein